MAQRKDPADFKIAVIGAGMTGLACAALLHDRGFRPTVFEKSRSHGGRLATRRFNNGLAIDHGAQYVTARSPAFQALVAQARESGAADDWQPRVHDAPNDHAANWIVGTPGMSRLVSPLAQNLDVRLNHRVTAIKRDGYGWRIKIREGADDLKCHAVVCTTPAPQAAILLASETALAEGLATVAMAPCWALLLILATPLDAGFDVWRSATDDLAWFARNASKPRRPAPKDSWAVHASPAWSQQHLELENNHIAEMMIERLPAAFGGLRPEIEHAIAHRWRYAMTTTPLGHPFLAHDDRTLFVGGDWCLGARVEYAFESGQTMARALIDTLKG